jgi:hypothetical protein
VSGVLFCGVQALSPAMHILFSCVTQQPHWSIISDLAEDAGTNDILVVYVLRTAWPLRAQQRGSNMPTSEISNAEERKRARRHKVARRLYEALMAQNPNRGITLCDESGKVVARHDPVPEHDAPEIAP